MPIPANPLGYTLIYVLPTPRGPVLIDAGWEHGDSWDALTAGLASIGFDITEVYGTIVTHFHPDHAGLAGRVREASGAWIAMHHADVEMVRSIDARGGLAVTDHDLTQLRRAGASAKERRDYAELGFRLDPPALPDRELTDGDLADLPDRVMRVVWTPGHSPGHICLHLEDSGKLFTGDHVLPRITPHIGLYPFDTPGRDPLGDFLESLSLIAKTGASEALPAHEHRFARPTTRANEIIAHHERRLSELRALLSTRPATLWELTSALTWGRPWTDMRLRSRRMAASETAAHLRTLERRQHALRGDAAAPGDLLYWRRHP